MKTDLNKLLPEVIRICTDTGAYIAKERQAFSTSSVEYKSLNDLVSYVDRTSEEKLCTALDRLCPGLGFETEEQQLVRSGISRWIIDPLDGTTNFIHNLPSYAISVALMIEGEIQLGVVYEITQQNVYSAVKHCNSCKNGKPIQVSSNTLFQNSLIATGFPISDFETKNNYLHFLGTLMNQTRGVRRLGAAAVDLCYTAEGKFDLFFEPQLKSWDVAAGALIVEGAGGAVYDFKKTKNWLYGAEIIAGNPLLINEFMQRMNRPA